MDLPGYNPKKNGSLDSLRKSEVQLLAILAQEYSENSGIWELDREIKKKHQANPRFYDKEALYKEFKDKEPEIIERSFGTRQNPIILAFGPDTYTAFIPGLMMPQELRAFHALMKIHGLLLTKVTARKTDIGWSYELN